MISLTVEPGDGGTSYYGKTGNEIQSDVRIDGTSISGTLNSIDDYKTFSKDTSKHHLVLKLSAPDGGTIETKMTGGSTVMKNYVTVDDGYCVYSVTAKDTQKIYVKVTKSDKSIEKIYDLKGLTLGEAV